MQTPYGWGVCLPWEADPAKLWMSRQALELLAPDRWLDYWCAEPVAWPGYVPMVRSWHLQEMPQPVIDRLKAHPEGETYVVFNEGHVVEQDDITPAKARDLALRFLTMARSLDCDVNWCGPNAGINFSDHGTAAYAHGRDWWREWLRLLRRAGIGSPSMHGVHLYHSTDPAMLQATWRTLVEEWRWQWMGSAPVIVTEICAEDQPYEYQAAVMNETAKLYEIGRKEGPGGQNGIMGAFWFITHGHRSWPNCALTEPDPDKVKTMRLTRLGKHWKSLQARLA